MTKNLVSFAEVKRAVSLEAVLARYGLLDDLVRAGANLTGRCPFCKGESKRQFRVSSEKNAWYCFGCKKGGNVLDFVAKKEGMSLPSAARALDQWFSLGLASSEAPRGEETPAPPARELPSEPPVPNQPLSFALKTLDPAHPSLTALGFSQATVERFGLGHCAKGLLKGRIAIPVHNPSGELLAYVGLAPEAEGPDRYLFPPKFHASLEIFNVHRIAKEPEEEGAVYLASDLLSALRLCDAGISRVLGLFDGTLSETQNQILADLLPEDSRLSLVGQGFDAHAVECLTWSFAVRSLGIEAIARPTMPESVVSE